MAESTVQVDRTKNPSHRWILFALSLALGGLGVYFSKDYIESEINSVREQYASDDPTVDVVVPSQDLIRGEVVSEAVMSLRKIPTQFVDSHSVTAADFDIAVGQRLDFDIDAGTALLWAHLEGGLSPTFSGRVPTGMRALTVQVDEINSVSGFLQPQDRIDLLFSYGDGDKRKIRPLIENLNVIATGIQTMVDKAGYSAGRAFTTITVQVSPNDAKKITLAQQIGQLTAVLRNPEDDGSLSNNSITLASLLNEGGVQTKRTTPAKARPIQKKKPSIEYIIGGIR